MGLIERLRAAIVPTERASVPISFDDWLSYFSFNGQTYPFGLMQTLQGDRESIGADFGGLVNGAYRSNGVVFAVELVRMLLFSEARFQFQQMRQGRPGDLFGTEDLRILEEPWPAGTTGDLLTRMLLYADFAGSAFVVRRGDRLSLPRPDWMTIVLGSRSGDADAADLDAEVLGYAYEPGGPGSGRPPEVLLPEQVAHFAPVPDPLARYRGMSWLTPIIREVMSDTAATTHKLKFFENGATPNMVVRLDSALSPDKFRQWVELFKQNHEGTVNAYKTLFLGGGADATVVGANLRQLDFKSTQGAGETRIAAAGGVPPVIVGLSEGLQAATYSNYGQARRRLADGTMRPLWRNAAGSLARIVPPPAGARLWYDDRDVPFLAEDVKDRAEVISTQASAIRTLVDGGFQPDAVVDAISAGDLKRLTTQHTGLLPVQLQPPGSGEPAPPAEAGASAAGEVRCFSCGSLLAERATAPWRITCRRCKTVNEADGPDVQVIDFLGAMRALGAPRAEPRLLTKRIERDERNRIIAIHEEVMASGE